MTMLAWLIFIPLQILWLPLSVLGGVWLAFKQIWVSRRLGLSQTAIEVVNGRWTADVFGLRQDRPSRRLAGKLPNNSVAGLYLVLLPLLVAKTIAGKPILYPLLPEDEKAGIANVVFSRTRRFDDLILSRASRVSQFVVLGAGLDTRCYGPLADQGLTLFELDQAANQRAKCEALKRAGLETAAVHYIEVDFARPRWIDSLISSSYDPKARSIFLWEGVTLYLSEADVRATLAAIKANAAEGSVVLVDIYAFRFLDLVGQGMLANKLLEATGEPLHFGLDLSTEAEARLETFVSSLSYRLGRRYFMGSDHPKGPYMAIVELEVAD